MHAAFAVVHFIDFTVTRFICGALYFFFIRSIIQYYMFSVIYVTLKQSHRDLRMTRFVPYWDVGICIKNNTKLQGGGLCTVEDS